MSGEKKFVAVIKNDPILSAIDDEFEEKRKALEERSKFVKKSMEELHAKSKDLHTQFWRKLESRLDAMEVHSPEYSTATHSLSISGGVIFSVKKGENDGDGIQNAIMRAIKSALED